METATSAVRSGTKQKVTAFVAMCFDGRLHPIYQRVVKPVLESHGYCCVRGDELCQTGTIIDQIRNAIVGSGLVLCDLTFENPNVFYEVGIAHALDKPTVMISQNPANAPFDVRHLRIIPYDDTKLGLLDLRESLSDFLAEVAPRGQRHARPQRGMQRHIAPNEVEVQRTCLFANSADVRRYAIKFLGECQDKASYPKIEQIAFGGDTADLVRDAFTALCKIDPQKARPLLLHSGLRYQVNLLVRERVVMLLGTYAPDPELLGQVIGQLGDSSWGVRRMACEVLGRWGQKGAAGALQNMLVDPEAQVRLAAAEALERLHAA